MKKLLMTAASLLLATGVASATGINLSWSDCGNGGESTKGFACNTNVGPPLLLVASFVPPAGVNRFSGLRAQMDIVAGTLLPDWWRHGVGQCRGTTALSVSFDFTSAPATCVDFFQGQAAGAFFYDVAYHAPNRARLRVECSVPDGNVGPVDPALEYDAFTVSLSKANTTGSGSCSGCLQEACIVLNDIQLLQPADAGFDPLISAAQDRSFVTYQSVTILDCPQNTPVRGRTWGQVKALYR